MKQRGTRRRSCIRFQRNENHVVKVCVFVCVDIGCPGNCEATGCVLGFFWEGWSVVDNKV